MISEVWIQTSPGSLSDWMNGAAMNDQFEPEWMNPTKPINETQFSFNSITDFLKLINWSWIHKQNELNWSLINEIRIEWAELVSNNVN